MVYLANMVIFHHVSMRIGGVVSALPSPAEQVSFQEQALLEDGLRRGVKIGGA